VAVTVSTTTVPQKRRYDRTSPFRWFLSHVKPFWAYLLFFLVGGLLWEVLSASVPIVTGRAFDAVLGSRRDQVALASAAALLAVVLVVRGVVAGFGGKFAQETMGNGFVRDLRDELYLELLRKGQTFFNRRPTGDLMARVTNDGEIVYLLFQPGLEFLLLIGVYGTVVPIVFIGLLRVQLLIAPLLFIATFALVIRAYNRRLGPVSHDVRASFGAMNEHLTETLSGVEHVRASGQREHERARFVARARAVRDATVAQSRVQAAYLAPLLLVLALAGGLLNGLVLETRGLLSIGGLVAYLGLIASLQQPIEAFGRGLMFVRMGQASVDRILELLNDEVAPDQAAARELPMRGEVELDRVSFGYDGAPVLRDVSLRVRPGETIAVVGQIGSGKSTLLKLINRTYDPDAGRVLVDGVDLREWSLGSLRSQIAVIEQDVVLFSRTIAENIAFGLGADADQAQVEDAARDAQAHQFITSFQDGYRTMLGERGVTLSGGQRQRIAIARALLTNPRILIMDDSTSAVDSETELEIQRAIARVSAGRTTFLITNRLPAIRRASRVVVLEAGRVLDVGEHTELLGRCDLYRRIFAAYQ
jgi:ATP-binding cassette subfamily B protein